MNYKNIKYGMIIGFLAAGVGAFVGQRVGFKKADRTIKNMASWNTLGIRIIDGIEYKIAVTKK